VTGGSAVVRHSLDLDELASRYVEDEPAHGLLVRNERAGLDPGDRLPDVAIQVAESLGGPGRLDPGLGLDAGLEAVVGEGEHPAVGVMDQDDLRGAQQALADSQRPDLVVGDDPAGVADDVRLALGQTQDRVDVQAGVHAGDHGDTAGWR